MSLFPRTSLPKALPALIALILLEIMGISFLSAQEVRHLEIESGILRGTVQALEKDSLGYMWIGTSQGLSRYSGYQTRNYAFDENGKRIIKSVSDIKNHRGKLLVLESNGKLFSYIYELGRFEELFSPNDVKASCISPLDKDKIIIGLQNGLLIYDLANGQSSELLFPELTFIRLIRKLGDRIFYSYLERDSGL